MWCWFFLCGFLGPPLWVFRSSLLYWVLSIFVFNFQNIINTIHIHHCYKIYVYSLCIWFVIFLGSFIKISMCLSLAFKMSSITFIFIIVTKFICTFFSLICHCVGFFYLFFHYVQISLFWLLEHHHNIHIHYCYKIYVYSLCV